MNASSLGITKFSSVCILDYLWKQWFYFYFYFIFFSHVDFYFEIRKDTFVIPSVYYWESLPAVLQSGFIASTVNVSAIARFKKQGAPDLTNRGWFTAVHFITVTQTVWGAGESAPSGNTRAQTTTTSPFTSSSILLVTRRGRRRRRRRRESYTRHPSLKVRCCLKAAADDPRGDQGIKGCRKLSSGRIWDAAGRGTWVCFHFSQVCTADVREKY